MKQLGVGGVITLNEPYETLVPTSLYYVSDCMQSKFHEFAEQIVCVCVDYLTKYIEMLPSTKSPPDYNLRVIYFYSYTLGIAGNSISL